ncbi:MAG: hypothetical protein FWB78_05955 [Treponema sp.]|nr:hypothetical protein [Treponema sp.]
MAITQTVEIPADRRLFIEVPREVPTGSVVLTFTPTTVDDCPLCAEHRDPQTGELRLNAETIAAIEEGRAMMRGEIPAKWYGSLDQMWDDLEKEEDAD